MSAAARWYLAGIAMLSLMLVATHFAMQVSAQQEAKKVVASWAKESELSIGDVRYRMLKGVLTLIDVRLNSEHAKLSVPVVSLHGNLSSLSGKEPAVAYVEIRGAHISLTATALKGIQAHETAWMPVLFHQLWNSAQRIGLYDLDFELLPEAGNFFPHQSSTINLAHLESSRTSGMRHVEGLAHWLGSEIKLETDEVLKGEASYVVGGSLIWKDLDASDFLDKILGLTALPGELNGQVNWKQKRDDQASYIINGETEIQDLTNQNKSGSLVWGGTLVGGKWHGDVVSVDWPLAMFSSQLPEFQGHKLVAGRLAGPLQLSGNLKQWKMATTEAKVSHISYRREASVREAFSEWRMESIQIANARVRWPGRHFYAKEVKLMSGNPVIDAGSFKSTLKSTHQAWAVDVDKINLNQITPNIRLSKGFLNLPMLEGGGSLKRNGKLQLKLQTLASDGEALAENWSVSGAGILGSTGERGLKFEIKAKKAGLVRFRSLLPEMIRRDASGISGDVDLQLHLAVDSAVWEASGEASVTDAHLQYDGEQWYAKAVKIGLDKIGSGLQEQNIRQVDVQGWKYQTALHPLHQSEMNEGVGAIDVADAASKDVSAEAWHIQELLLRKGRISVGHADAIWAQNAEISVKNFRPGLAAPVEMNAVLGGGSFVMKGQLMWVSAMPELNKAKIWIRDVLPFFMNDWLKVSGMPEFVRGRLYADIALQKSETGPYKGLGYLRLQHGLLGPVLTSNDPLLSRVGFNVHDIFLSLQKAGAVRLRVPLQAEGAVGNVLGDALIQAMKLEMANQGHFTKSVDVTRGRLLSSIRLHGRGSLSQNERVRLRNVIREMKKNPKQAVELKPQLNASLQAAKQIERARYTQQLIEKFLVGRGISRTRIFPVWPGKQHRSSSSTSGIGIVTIP